LARRVSIRADFAPSSLFAATAMDFGLLEHLEKTRFPVPKITSFVSPPILAGLENQVELQTTRSKNTRIRA
jgi:hypothetical protein